MNRRYNTLLAQCIAEFIGTGLLIIFGVGCVAPVVLTNASFGQWEISLVWGMGVAIAIYCTAGVSGAHINPAVTIALWLTKQFEGRKVLPYIISQLLGAFCAAALVYALFSQLFVWQEVETGTVRGSAYSLSTASIFTTFAHSALSFTGAFAVEFVITAILMFAILALADDNNGGANKALTPLFIGLLIAVIGGSLGTLTGFAMNPARDFGPRLFTYFSSWGDIAMTGGMDIPYFIVPIVAPICGACFGAVLYVKLIGNYLAQQE